MVKYVLLNILNIISLYKHNIKLQKRNIVYAPKLHLCFFLIHHNITFSFRILHIKVFCALKSQVISVI